MLSWTSFSQSTRNKTSKIPTRIVKVSTLKAMGKDLEICDSLRVAFNNQSKQLDNLIESNLLMFKDVNELRTENKESRNELKELNKKIIKEAQKNNNGLLFGVGGTTLGLIIGILITK